MLEYWRKPPLPAALDRDQIDAALRLKPDEGLTAGALRDYARQQGFHAFVFNGQIALSGAQPPEALWSAMRRSIDRAATA